jgi:hypothetical protein
MHGLPLIRERLVRTPILVGQMNLRSLDVWQGENMPKKPILALFIPNQLSEAELSSW